MHFHRRARPAKNQLSLFDYGNRGERNGDAFQPRFIRRVVAASSSGPVHDKPFDFWDSEASHAEFPLR